MTTAEKISKLCEQWCEAASKESGGVGIGPSTETFRLGSNDIEFPKLDRDGLAAAIIGLSKVLVLQPSLNVFTHTDHQDMWAWCGELLLHTEPFLFPNEQFELAQLCATTLHAALANREGLKPGCIPNHDLWLVYGSHVTMGYMAFPMLEGILKKSCSQYLDFGGIVIDSFRKSKGGSYKVGDQCSSIRDLLLLLRERVARIELQQELDEFMRHVSAIGGGKDAYDVIYRWRNQTLHAQTSFAVVGGIVLNLSLLISLYSFIWDDYSDRQTYSVASISSVRPGDIRHQFSMYPP